MTYISVMSPKRRRPRQRLTPGSPSPLRAEEPPSQRTAVRQSGGVGGGVGFFIRRQHKACHSSGVKKMVQGAVGNVRPTVSILPP